jgi:hypothetical protein
MMVVKLEMWPAGEHARARCIGLATFSLVGRHLPSDTRGYDVMLLKAPTYGGPNADEVDRIKNPYMRDIWRRIGVVGHTPGRGKRGTWDLIGAALQLVLGRRLAQYTSVPISELRALTTADSALTEEPVPPTVVALGDLADHLDEYANRLRSEAQAAGVDSADAAVRLTVKSRAVAECADIARKRARTLAYDEACRGPHS